MKAIRLERHLEQNRCLFTQDANINGSNVDYLIEEPGSRALILVREKLTESILDYLNGVGNHWDKKIAISIQPISNEVYRVSSLLGIVVATEDELGQLPLPVKSDSSNGSSVYAELIERLSKASWGSRALVIITAGWKEIAAVFVLGVFSAVFIQDKVLPFANDLLRKLGFAS